VNVFLAKKDKNDWVQKCRDYEEEDARPRCRPKKKPGKSLRKRPSDLTIKLNKVSP